MVTVRLRYGYGYGEVTWLRYGTGFYKNPYLRNQPPYPPSVSPPLAIKKEKAG